MTQATASPEMESRCFNIFILTLECRPFPSEFCVQQALVTVQFPGVAPDDLHSQVVLRQILRKAQLGGGEGEADGILCLGILQVKLDRPGFLLQTLKKQMVQKLQLILLRVLS